MARIPCSAEDLDAPDEMREFPASLRGVAPNKKEDRNSDPLFQPQRSTCQETRAVAQDPASPTETHLKS